MTYQRSIYAYRQARHPITLGMGFLECCYNKGMQIEKNHPLKNLNAFGVEAKAKYFTELNNISDARELVNSSFMQSEKIYILGQGWNTLFTKDFDGLVIRVNIKGIKVESQNGGKVIVEAGAGEDWIGFVNYAVSKEWGGIENLSHIPGSVGAGVYQNIAAYGQNFDEAFVELEAINLKNGQIEKFDKKRCEFGYRKSVFKTKLKNKYLILNVKFVLSENPEINTSYHSRYGSLVGELSKFAKPPYTLQDVARAVINIRRTKFPDWKVTGTAGSFFLNPVITKSKLKELQKIVPNVQFYPLDKLTYPMPDDPNFDHSNYVKVAAGWLLEELGWKGKRIGDVGTSPNQALVVINYGNAAPEDIIAFTKKMQADFEQKYGIKLEPEVNII